MKCVCVCDLNFFFTFQTDNGLVHYTTIRAAAQRHAYVYL